MFFFLLCGVFGVGARAEPVVYASWYGEWHHGRVMANGKPFDMHNPRIAAHRFLPFGTRLRVTNPETKVSQVVVVQDRGPYTDDPERVLDLSKAAAQKLGFVDAGVAPVQIAFLD